VVLESWWSSVVLYVKESVVCVPGFWDPAEGKKVFDLFLLI
jgi:hypothetical protein